MVEHDAGEMIRRIMPHDRRDRERCDDRGRMAETVAILPSCVADRMPPNAATDMTSPAAKVSRVGSGTRVATYTVMIGSIDMTPPT